MRKFIVNILAISFPVIVLLVGTNYIMDPAKLFKIGYENTMAEIIISGNNVTNIDNFDDRIFQKELISKLDESPQIIILGSSRTMMIRKEQFTGKTFLNNSVSGASIEDLIAIYQIYVEHHHLPEKIILGIDPWTFNENNDQKRWQSIASYYNSFHHQNASSLYEILEINKYIQLLSFSYFQASINKLIHPNSKLTDPISTQEKFNSTNTRLTDGSLVYGDSYRNATQEEVNSKINKYISGEIYSLEGFDNISEDIWKEFQTFLKTLESEGIEVEIFLAPYAPKVYETVTKKYPNVLKTEEMIKEFALNNQLKVYGSFDPNKLGFDESYFFDGMHLKEQGVQIIIKQ